MDHNDATAWIQFGIALFTTVVSIAGSQFVQLFRSRHLADLRAVAEAEIAAKLGEAQSKIADAANARADEWQSTCTELQKRIRELELDNRRLRRRG